MKKRISSIDALAHQRPIRCPLCDARLGPNEMGIRSHLRRHLREMGEEDLKSPHTVFFQFLGSEYWRTSIFVEYARKHMEGGKTK